MILYFSGTGNSRYTAQAMASITGDEIISINEMIKRGSKAVMKSEAPFIFVVPTYAWRIPRVVEKFIREAEFSGSREVYFVLTCGSETNNAIHYTKRLCKDKGFKHLGLASIVMPENYITMYRAPEEVVEKEIIKQATPQILEIAKLIKDKKTLPEEKVTMGGRFSSGIVNTIFYPICVSAKGFYTTDACTGCGKCVKICPLNNIQLLSGKPQWGESCTQCMACICGCPGQAIEYDKKTQGKRRYYNPGYLK